MTASEANGERREGERSKTERRERRERSETERKQRYERIANLLLRIYYYVVLLEHNGLVSIPSNQSIDHAKALHGTTLYCSCTANRPKGLEHII